jgi:NAD(P)-dependent dehydrogenase (short-subunit alcohol dehydrogenase family)
MTEVNGHWTADDIPDLSGSVSIVTGANSGTGYEATKELARAGSHVIMGCRNLEKAKVAKTKILEEIPDVSLEIIQLDLSDLSSVRTFSNSVKSSYSTIDILLNNAGIMMVPKRIETSDGFELQLGINHFGHFALTGLLFDLIAEANGRIVSMSSGAHIMGNMDFENLNWEREGTYGGAGAYGRSKLANLLFIYELDRRLKQSRNGVKAMGAHPGWARTNLQTTGVNTGNKTIRSRLTRAILAFGNTFLAQSAHMGALPMLYAATDPDAESGAYYGPSGRTGRGYPKKVDSSNLSHDEAIAKELWEVSEKLTGMTYSFQLPENPLVP